MRRCAGCVVLALWVASAFGADAELQQVWAELFAQPQPVAAEKQIEAVLAACGNDPVKLKLLIAADSAYRAFEPGWCRRRTKVAHGQTRYDVEFHVRVPRGYSPKKTYPLLLAAHGQGGSGRHIGAMMERLLGPAVERYVIVAPTMPGPKHFSGKPYQEQAYLKPLNWARRNLNIDDRRIYVSGYSQGGHCAWHMATMYPRLFAAAVPMAGVPWFEGSPYVNDSYMGNLSNLPLWAIWGEKDRARPPAMGVVEFCRAAAGRLAALGNKRFTGTELPGVGHGGAWPKAGEFPRYLASQVRVAAPNKLTHVFHLGHHRRGYYLEAVELARGPLDFDRPPQVRIALAPGRTPTTRETVDAVRRHLEKFMFSLRGELDTANNALTIRAVNVRSVRVYVIERMFDLSRPVRLRLGGRTWRTKIPISPRCMLTHYAACRDAAALVVNEVDLEVTGKLTVRAK